MSENIQINLAGSQSELVIRHGDAQPLPARRALTIRGLLHAPGEFVQKRKQVIDPATTHVTVDYEAAKIQLVTGEDTEYATTIVGSMAQNPYFAEFQINGAPWGSPQGLGEFLRRNRRFFADPTEAAKVIQSLTDFKAKVEREIEKADDKRGGKRDILTQKVTTEMPKGFVLEIPLFKGMPAARFLVEMFFDIRDAGCTVSLDSVEAMEASIAASKEAIDSELDHFNDYVTVVV